MRQEHAHDPRRSNKRSFENSRAPSATLSPPPAARTAHVLQIPLAPRITAAASTSLAFLPIPLFAALIYAVQKYNFLQIGRQTNLMYAVSATFLALLYLSLVRRVSGLLEPVLPPEATASILLFVLVIFVEPIQRLLSERIRETAEDRMVINELSSRFPEEGGLYVWAKEAFGDFHGFVAGWTYWIYTIFYFPGLLLASTSMSAYVLGGKGGALAQDRTFLLIGSLVLLAVAVILNLIGLNIGKWLQNAGGASTYVPLLILVAIGGVLWAKQGSVTHFTLANIVPTWNWDTVNFWSQIAFAFTGLELVSAMSGEIREPRKTLPRALIAAAALIAGMRGGTNLR